MGQTEKKPTEKDNIMVEALLLSEEGLIVGVGFGSPNNQWDVFKDVLQLRVGKQCGHINEDCGEHLNRGFLGG